MRWLLIATRKQCLPRTVVSEMAATPFSCSRSMISTLRRFKAGSPRPGGQQRKQTMVMVVRPTRSRSGSAAINPLEVIALGDILIDETSEFLDPVLLERHPDLQSAKSAARLQAIIIEPCCGREAAWRFFQIFLWYREGRQMSGGIANQNASHFEGRTT